jgi:hypothetical protein
VGATMLLIVKGDRIEDGQRSVRIPEYWLFDCSIAANEVLIRNCQHETSDKSNSLAPWRAQNDVRERFLWPCTYPSFLTTVSSTLARMLDIVPVKIKPTSYLLHRLSLLRLPLAHFSSSQRRRRVPLRLPPDTSDDNMIRKSLTVQNGTNDSENGIPDRILNGDVQLQHFRGVVSDTLVVKGRAKTEGWYGEQL